MFSKIKNFLSGSVQELKNVHWPTREEAIKLTVVVILASAALALFLGAFDILFTYLLKNFVVGY